MQNPRRNSVSPLFLFAANLVPIVGVCLFGWSASSLLILYWLESVVIGILNVPKIIACRDRSKHTVFAALGAVYTAIFFCVHFGAFTYAHGLIVFTLFGALDTAQATSALSLADIEALELGRSSFSLRAIQQSGLLWAAASLAASHVFSMFYNFFGKQEYLARTAQQQMFIPYKRIFVMHFVIVIAAGLVTRFPTPMLALMLLIALKTFLDLWAHIREHKIQTAS